MIDAERLFGLPGAEQLHREPAEVWESDIEPHLDEYDQDAWDIEEWTVSAARTHLPSAERVIDWILSTLDVYEYGYDAFDNASRESEVESMLEAWASRVTYRMADTLVATHHLTLVDEQPFLDGEPLYVSSEVAATPSPQVEP